MKPNSDKETTGPACGSCASRGCPTPAKCIEIERLRDVLRHIATMECFTREGEEEPHLLMMRLAKEALNV